MTERALDERFRTRELRALLIEELEHESGSVPAESGGARSR